MKKPPTLLLVTLMMSALGFVSCETDDDDFLICTCHHGGSIDDWEEATDTTEVFRKDSVGGFDISVNDWQNSEKHDIPL